MIGRRELVGAPGGLSLLTIGGCWLLSTDSYRYKITVEVDTPEGLKSGFAVREVSYSEQLIKLPDATGVTTRQRGDAVAIDLPGGKALFALLPVNACEPLQAAFGNDAPATLDAAKADGRVAVLAQTRSKVGYDKGVAVIKQVQTYPILVTFTDIADPASVRRVDPADLAASFGPGVRLKRITVRITDDPVTTGIEKRLRWLPRVYEIMKGTAFRPEGVPVGDYRRLFTTKEFQ